MPLFCDVISQVRRSPRGAQGCARIDGRAEPTIEIDRVVDVGRKGKEVRYGTFDGAAADDGRAEDALLESPH